MTAERERVRATLEKKRAGAFEGVEPTVLISELRKVYPPRGQAPPKVASRPTCCRCPSRLPLVTSRDLPSAAVRRSSP